MLTHLVNSLPRIQTHTCRARALWALNSPLSICDIGESSLNFNFWDLAQLSIQRLDRKLSVATRHRLAMMPGDGVG